MAALLQRWEASPFNYVTQNSVFFKKHNLQDLSLRDGFITTDFYKDRWADLSKKEREVTFYHSPHPTTSPGSRCA